MSKKETDLDKKFKKVSKKTDIKILRENMGVEAELKKLEKEIEKVSSNNIKEFDINKKPLYNYLDIGSTSDFVERYRNRLNNL